MVNKQGYYFIPVGLKVFWLTSRNRAETVKGVCRDMKEVPSIDMGLYSEWCSKSQRYDFKRIFLFFTCFFNTNKSLINILSSLCCPWGGGGAPPLPPDDSYMPHLYRCQVREELPNHLLTFFCSIQKRERKREL